MNASRFVFLFLNFFFRVASSPQFIVQIPFVKNSAESKLRCSIMRLTFTAYFIIKIIIGGLVCNLQYCSSTSSHILYYYFSEFKLNSVKCRNHCAILNSNKQPRHKYYLSFWLPHTHPHTHIQRERERDTESKRERDLTIIIDKMEHPNISID